ncbi:UBC-like protein [Pisolithus marmoratus]|nr:UBC-like protein [Pisolithus marmoratus]
MPPLNRNNTAVKRIMQEARELASDPCTDYHAAPLEDDIFEWHCTLRGPTGTEFEGGLYHFRILLPAEYPFRPPSLMMLTPNGRFELNTKICISFTNYHEEEWQPAWGVRTAILGLQGFFPLRGQAANGVGSVEYPISERKRLAQLSREWVCPKCRMSNLEYLPDLPSKIDGPPELVGETVTRTQTPTMFLDPFLENSDCPSRNNPETSSTQPDTPPPTAIRQVPERVPETGDQSNLVSALDTTRRSTLRPPLLLDTAICMLLVLVVGLLCRRVLVTERVGGVPWYVVDSP